MKSDHINTPLNRSAGLDAPFRREADAILRHAGQQEDDDIDLGHVALALSLRQEPSPKKSFFKRGLFAYRWHPLSRYQRHLETIAKDVQHCFRRNKGQTAEDCLAALNEAIIARQGYSGDSETYEDLRNANFMRVMDRKRGLPVALGILFIAAARAQGWDAKGIDFPGHFLFRLEYQGTRLIIDPFHHGLTHDAASLRALLKIVTGQETALDPEHYRPTTNREILLRLQNNLKLRLVRGRHVEKAADIVEAMLLFAPNRTMLWREYALLQAHVGNIGMAITSLETYIERERGHQPRYEAALLLKELKRRLS